MVIVDSAVANVLFRRVAVVSGSGVGVSVLLLLKNKGVEKAGAPTERGRLLRAGQCLALGKEGHDLVQRDKVLSSQGCVDAVPLGASQALTTAATLVATASAGVSSAVVILCFLSRCP